MHLDDLAGGICLALATGATGAASGAGIPFAVTPKRAGELPLMMPANLNRKQVLFECEGTGEAVDLEGDVGVVGRLLSDDSDKDRSGLQVDLKVGLGRCR